MNTGAVGKDVRSALLNLAAQGGRNAVDAGDFQKVWSSQMSKGATGGTVQDNATAGNKDAAGRQDAGKSSLTGRAENGKETARQLKPEDSLKAREVRQTQGPEAEAVEEMAPEDLEQAMEILGTAAQELMQQVAEAFGMPVEELQAAMEELGLDQLDILGAPMLGELLLKLGGAEDSYALLMDESLYGDYQALMGELDGTLQEVADTLGLDRGQLTQLLEEAAHGQREAGELTEVAEEILPVQQEESEAEEVEPQRVLYTEAPAGEAGIAQTVRETDTSSEEQASQGRDGSQARENRHGESRSSARAHQENVYVQDFRTAQFEPGAQQTQSVYTGSSWSPETRDIMNQIMDYMRLQLRADTTSLEMQLHPASLGTLQVQIASKGGVVTANFITQNEAVKAALESQMQQLKESFEERGVKIEAVEVTVQTHEFERNLEQGRGREQQETQRRSRGRRIRLDSNLTAEDPEEETARAADRMAANGSTVEYSV